MRRVIPLLAIAASLIFTIAVYQRLPASVPIHWGIDGRPDGWAPRPLGALLMPGVAILVYLALQVVLRQAWRDGRDAPYVRATETIIAMVVSFLSFAHVVMLGSTLGWRIDVVQVIVLGMSVLLITIGFQIVGMPRNPWFGFRTPWTLRSDRVWERTHRVGSKVLVISGITMGLSTLLAPRWTFGIILLTALAMLIATIGYSYWIARDAPD